ncbi:hypothetical protein OPV22_000738 [Ensete ventricosum]|uniref:Endoplasmic reticulum oxidoreductin-1 n=1 Tax=Ensete ventricosum TaxID=4639 RepID=A0AAV8RJS2_ENSVE|nr:hypothetical protein OPV22_000738 [Ensete ventricosum]
MGKGEATFAGDDGGGKSRRRWAWAAAGALTAVALAIAAGSRNALEIPASATNSCECPPGSRSYTGLVENCCCDYETANSLNAQVLHPILHELVKTPFFRYFKVKLWCDCPFWPDDGMCHLRDCTEGKPQAAVDRTLDDTIFKGWIEIDNSWTHDDETDDAAMTYENCPQYPSEEWCDEKKVMYKLISGLHSLISVHIASECLLDSSANLGQNVQMLYDRVWKNPDRVRNLYFILLFVLRAVTKAADYLEQAEYNTGNHVEDLKTESLVRQLLYNNKLLSACPVPFDEAKLWQGQNGPDLLQQIQNQFRNISALMNCVGCEKCRLWGKLQVNGLATALKVLFSVGGKNNLNKTLQLQRNEVIVLSAKLPGSNMNFHGLILVSLVRDKNEWTRERDN